jgi:hypothetical protein
MLKNRGKSKLSKTVLFNTNKHVFHCEKSLGTLVYGQPRISALRKLHLVGELHSVNMNEVACLVNINALQFLNYIFQLVQMLFIFFRTMSLSAGGSISVSQNLANNSFVIFISKISIFI